MACSSYLIANWKMHFSIEEARALIENFGSIVRKDSQVYVGVAPTMLCIPDCLSASRDRVQVGAQNAHWQKSGALTGEVSAHTLQELGATFVICGHSERRHQFGESNELVASRTLGILELGMQVVHCVGETIDERGAGLTNQVLFEQIDPIFSKATADQLKNLIIAYEPVWAIGTGRVAEISEIQEAHCYIQSIWRSGSPCPPILYGGSVKPDNYSSILEIPEVRGALVGGASLTYESFSALYQIALEQA